MQYIGFTQTTLSQRLTFHRQNGSIYSHFKEHHHIKPTREQLTNNTNIISRGNDRLRLAIKESLLILDKKMEINKQYDNFTNILKLHNSRSELKQQMPQLPPHPTPSPAPDPKDTQIHISEDPPPIPSLRSDCVSMSRQVTAKDQYENVPASLIPMGPFSPKTIRLLTLPIKVASFNFDEISKTKQQQSKVSSKQLHQGHEIHTLHNNTCDKSFDSPNIKSLNSDTTDTLDQCSMPDMMDVLTKFGIDVSFPNEPMDEFTELSISQRIKSLRRSARHKPTSGTLETNRYISTDLVETSCILIEEENDPKLD